MRGRKPTPSAIKELNGNPGKRALNQHEAQTATDKPTCPGHLDAEARKEWQRISKLLHTAGLLTTIDRAALSGYCTAYSRWIEAETQLKKHGLIVKSPSGYPMQNPYLGVANKAMREVRSWLTEFGMTPSSRSRIATNPPETNELDDFLNA